MDMDDFFALFLKMKARELEEKVWDIWVHAYPHMTKENFVTYEEMLQNAKGEEPEGVYIDQFLL
jgi:hypothetical protein